MEIYVEMLKQEFLSRKQRRSQYSERAFARDLKVSSSFISLLFSGKRSMSPKTSLKVVSVLNWTEQDVEKFIQSVQASQFLEKEKPKQPAASVARQELEIDQFRLISNILHFAVFEFLQTRKITSLEQIVNYFEIEKIECELILSRLLRLGMVQVVGGVYKAESKDTQLKGTPSEAIRNYHRQALELAIESIESQSFEKRELRALTLSMDPGKVKQAKKTIDKFVGEFNKKFGNKNKGEIYQMNVQLFSHKKEEGEG